MSEYVDSPVQDDYEGGDVTPENAEDPVLQDEEDGDVT